MNFAMKHMRKANQEIKERWILDEILSDGTICRVAMTDGDWPYIVPVNYGFRDGSLYIHSAPRGKKLDLLARNNRICFEVENTVEIIKGEQACDWSTRYRSVVGYGTVEVLTDNESKQQGLEVIMAQHGAPELVSFKQKEMDRMVILRIAISSLTGKQSSNW